MDLVSTIKLFKYYKRLADQTFDQLDEKDLFWEYQAGNNSIAIIVQHLVGNMLSRFTDFLKSDGEKSWRDRDKEFVLLLRNKQDLLDRWEAGWNTLFSAIEHLDDVDLQEVVYIRKIGHTVPEAIQRQLAHYAYHIGQIVLIGKMIKGQNWKSLSILPGASSIYNREKFKQPKSKGHFTDEFLDTER
ncbi:MAG: DUF1572 family protein [Saprospiraceae bacterium]|nr:DUF1572 family protein [Saprospiraceae bacterium]